MTLNAASRRTVGEDFEPRSFSVAGPVIIAGIGRIPTTPEDRSITIPLRRRLKNEQIKRLRFCNRNCRSSSTDSDGKLRDGLPITSLPWRTPILNSQDN